MTGDEGTHIGTVVTISGLVWHIFADDLPIDDYRELRRTGAFLLIDEADGATLAAGMAETADRYAGASI